MKPLTVVSWGGGNDSTGMIVEMVKRRDHFDLILSADTGAEKPHTYAYVKTFRDWLTANGVRDEQLQIVKRRSETLEQDCLNRKVLPSVAYGFKSCSDHFKVRPQREFVSKVWEPGIKARAAREPITWCVGFATDEKQRVRESDRLWIKNRFPLIEYGFSKRDAERVIEEAGLPTPGKSACFFCPNSSKYDVLTLRQTYPRLYERALAVESNADLTTIKGLGRRYSWRDLGDLQDDTEKPMPCVCSV